MTAEMAAKILAETLQYRRSAWEDGVYEAWKYYPDFINSDLPDASPGAVEDMARRCLQRVQRDDAFIADAMEAEIEAFEAPFWATCGFGRGSLVALALVDRGYSS